MLCPVCGAGLLVTNSASSTDLAVLLAAVGKAGWTSLRIGLDGGLCSPPSLSADRSMRKYSGLMNGDALWGEDCLSGDGDRKGRWHVGQSEKEGDGVAPRRMSCRV